MIDLIVQEHVKWYLISRLVFIEIYIPRVIHGAYNILHAIGDLKNAIGAGSCIFSMVKAYIIIDLMPAFIHISYEFVRKKRGSINKAFISVPYFKEIIKERI